MAYDEDLAHRIRELLGDEPGLGERPMFGGLAFMLDGNMCVAVLSRGVLLVRTGRDGAEEALDRPHTRVARMGERVMRGWVFVEPAGLASKRDLAEWVGRGAAVARSLPTK